MNAVRKQLIFPYFTTVLFLQLNVTLVQCQVMLNVKET